jgi:hypothetical protein
MTATWDALQASDIPIRVRALRPDEVTNDKASRDLVVVVEPTGEVGPAELAQFFADKRETLRTLLCEHGSVLFRGFPVERAAFAEIVGTGFMPTGICGCFRRLRALPVGFFVFQSLAG